MCRWVELDDVCLPDEAEPVADERHAADGANALARRLDSAAAGAGAFGMGVFVEDLAFNGEAVLGPEAF
jgi:hypothetical protein